METHVFPYSSEKTRFFYDLKAALRRSIRVHWQRFSTASVQCCDLSVVRLAGQHCLRADWQLGTACSASIYADDVWDSPTRHPLICVVICNPPDCTVVPDRCTSSVMSTSQSESRPTRLHITYKWTHSLFVKTRIPEWSTNVVPCSRSRLTNDSHHSYPEICFYSCLLETSPVKSLNTSCCWPHNIVMALKRCIFYFYLRRGRGRIGLILAPVGIQDHFFYSPTW